MSVRDCAAGSRERLGEVSPEAGRVCGLSGAFQGPDRLGQAPESASEAAARAPEPDRPGGCAYSSDPAEHVSRILSAPET